MPEILRGDVSPKWDHLCSRYLEMIFSGEWDHLYPRYLEMIFFTRMGPSVPKIFRDDFSREWDHLYPRYLEMIFSRQCDHLCPRYLEMIFSRQCDHLCPRYLEMIFSREWDHLCPRYLGLMFHPSGTICAQNIRFYIEATLSVHGEIIFPVCCFLAFLNCFLFLIHIFISLVLFCLLVVFPCFSFVCFCLYIFLFNLSFFACMSVLLVFFFQMCSSRGSGADSWLHSRIICSHGLVASRKQCLHQKRKVPFVLIWLILSTRSFGALSNGFCHMPANTFHVAAYLQCLILKQILLLLHLMLFTVSTGFNAWPVCRGFLILSFLL